MKHVSETELTHTIDALIKHEQLPLSYVETVRKTILPLADHILECRARLGRPVIIGIHGAQGTGKSTLTLFLRDILSRHRHCPTASFSLDDLYLTRAERQSLAHTVHPLFQTRGVPGTHDVALGLQVIDRLVHAGHGDHTAIPAFDKAMDDRIPRSHWPVFQGPAEVVLFEGWCVGARPERDEAALQAPVNRLEAEEDPGGHWRRYVNDCLDAGYRSLFDQLDSLVMLKAPAMASVLEWRRLQEHKLAERQKIAPEQGEGGAGAHPLRIMSDAEVARFIQHYERVTRTCLAEMPGRANVLIEVAEDHTLGLPRFRTP